jgi:copper homeostasis protein (lipoprotein)
MNYFKHTALFLLVLSVVFVACNRNPGDDKKNNTRIIKGLYSYGPEIKSFTDCEEGREYWVADSAKTLELGYSKFNFEKPYEPVYIEAEGHVIKSDSLMVSADFDSTLVITKLIKITKAIPEGPCNQ